MTNLGMKRKKGCRAISREGGKRDSGEGNEKRELCTGAAGKGKKGLEVRKFHDFTEGELGPPFKSFCTFLGERRSEH